MLLVKTKVGPSEIHGNGLFAAEDISKGTPTWKFEPAFDRSYTEEEFNDLLNTLPAPASAYLKFHAFKSIQSGRYILDSDNDKFSNHSDNPNVGPSDGLLHEGELVYMAVRDIKKGEEITNNYGNFIYEMK